MTEIDSCIKIGIASGGGGPMVTSFISQCSHQIDKTRDVRVIMVVLRERALIPSSLVSNSTLAINRRLSEITASMSITTAIGFCGSESSSKTSLPFLYFEIPSLLALVVCPIL